MIPGYIRRIGACLLALACACAAAGCAGGGPAEATGTEAPPAPTGTASPPPATGTAEPRSDETDPASQKGEDPVEREPDTRTLTPAEYTVLHLTGTDALGRRIPPRDGLRPGDRRYVGIWYSLWLGQHRNMQTGIYDIGKLLSTKEGRAALASGTDSELSRTGEFHFCGEPLFGYYTMRDEWVLWRHMEMLTLAGIDYLAIDATNAQYYPEVCDRLFAVLDELQRQGFAPPKIMFYTNSYSGRTVRQLYNAFFQTERHDNLWFAPNGKPMIAGITEHNAEASDQTRYPESYGASATDFIPAEIRDRFDIVESQWPNGALNEASIPWMSWEYPQHLHRESGAMSVSVAQHSPSRIHFSYMDPQSSRGYDHRKGTVEENWQAGRNFEDEWQTAIRRRRSVRNVLVTGWNEWMAIKTPLPEGGFAFCDAYSPEYSRDIEPDAGVYGDNFYLQLMRNLREFKYTDARRYEMPKMRIDLTKDSSLVQWDHVKARYLDPEGDARPRLAENATGTDVLRDDSNRNDICEIRVAHDSTSLHLYIRTARDVTAPEAGDAGWMNVLIGTDAAPDDGRDFCGFQYVVNRRPNGTKTSVERSVGGYAFETVGEADMRVRGNVLFLTIPLSSLGLSANDCSFRFKVTDNVRNPQDIMNYYVSGDCAPIGRLSYAYGY